MGYETNERVEDAAIGIIEKCHPHLKGARICYGLQGESKGREDSMNRIGAAWDSYQKQVIPRNAGSVQRMECRRAFYAVAQAMLVAVVTLLGSEPTDAELEMACVLDAELTAFADAVKRGKA